MTRPRHKHLVLSLFPGIDLFGRGFELEGFCVVRGPDLLWGQDVRSFHPCRHAFAGIIGGSPCQDFSKINRRGSIGYSDQMLAEYTRCVTEAEPDWFLLENVPQVPNIVVPGYKVQRFNLNASECRLSCLGGVARQNIELWATACQSRWGVSWRSQCDAGSILRTAPTDC